MLKPFSTEFPPVRLKGKPTFLPFTCTGIRVKDQFLWWNSSFYHSEAVQRLQISTTQLQELQIFQRRFTLNNISDQIILNGLKEFSVLLEPNINAKGDLP